MATGLTSLQYRDFGKFPKKIRDINCTAVATKPNPLNSGKNATYIPDNMVSAVFSFAQKLN